jgi:hypothetical protein
VTSCRIVVKEQFICLGSTGHSDGECIALSRRRRKMTDVIGCKIDETGSKLLTLCLPIAALCWRKAHSFVYVEVEFVVHHVIMHVVNVYGVD